MLGEIESPIKGAKKGNIEYLVHLKKKLSSGVTGYGDNKLCRS